MPYKNQSQYPGAKVLKDWLSANAAYTAGTYSDLGNITMGALQSLQLGRGSQQGQDTAVGRCWASLKDTSATPVSLSGRIRLAVYDPNSAPVANGILLDERTEALAVIGSTTSRQYAFPLPSRGAQLAPNYSLHLLLNVDKGLGDDGTLDYTTSTLYVDCMEYTLVLV